jgi:hypothetical protein
MILTTCKYFDLVGNRCSRVTDGKCNDLQDCEFKYIAELKAENEKLRHSNENLRLALKTYEMPEVVKVLTDWRTGELDLRINKYKQTLQEIKAIAEELLEKGLEPQSVEHQLRLKGKRELASIISDLITKAEEE